MATLFSGPSPAQRLLYSAFMWRLPVDRRVTALWLGCLAQVAASQPVHAQTPQNQMQTTPPVFATEVLVTAERGAAPRDNTASATALLERADIDRLPGNSLPALMTFLPGFHVLFSSDFAGTPMVQSRGFFGGGEAEYVQLVVDGVPAGDPEAGLADWRRIRAWDIERIEARRGPSSALYGDTALGGVIQVITRRDVPRGGAAFSAGSFGALAVDAGLSRQIGAAMATVTAAAFRADGFRSHGETREGALSAAVEHGSPNHRVTVRAGAERRHQDEPGPRSLVELDTDRFGSDPMFHADNEINTRARSSAEYGYTGSSLAMNILAYAAVRDADRTRTLLLAPGLGSPAARDLSTSTGGATVRIEHHGAFLAGTTATRAGAEMAGDDVHSQYRAALQGEPAAGIDGTRRRLGVYVSESWNATERLRVSGGLRYDRIADRFAGATAGSPDHEAWSPRFGVTYRLLDRASSATTVFVEAVRAFKAPTLDQLFDPRPFPDFAGGTFVISNPALRPQRAANLEAGVRHTTGASRVELIAYRMQVDDEIDFDPATFTYSNIGATLHSGIEAEAHWRRFERFTPSLLYSWTRVEPVGRPEVTQLKNIPRHLVKPALMVQLPGSVSATIAYTRTAGTFLDDEHVFPLNDMSSLDLRIGKQYRRLTATIDLLNVTADESEQVGYALFDFGGVARPYYFPSPGFGARAGLQLRF